MRDQSIREKEETQTTSGCCNNTCSPFHCFQVAARVFLKCLGLEGTSDNNTNKSPTDDDQEDTTSQQSSSSSSLDIDPPSTSDEQGMKTMEDVAAKSSILISLVRRPTRPPISSGRGGQIN